MFYANFCGINYYFYTVLWRSYIKNSVKNSKYINMTSPNGKEAINQA